MTTRTIRVSEAEDRKLWRLILRNKCDGMCSDPYTYFFTTEQLEMIKKAGIHFEEIRLCSARGSEARRASGATKR